MPPPGFSSGFFIFEPVDKVSYLRAFCVETVLKASQTSSQVSHSNPGGDTIIKHFWGWRDWDILPEVKQFTPLPFWN